MNHEQKKNREALKEREVTKGGAMSRKEAIKKSGYIALSATAMMLLLSKPDKAVAQSPARPPVFF